MDQHYSLVTLPSALDFIFLDRTSFSMVIVFSAIDDDVPNANREFSLSLDLAITMGLFNLTVPEARVIIVDDDMEAPGEK